MKTIVPPQSRRRAQGRLLIRGSTKREDNRTVFLRFFVTRPLLSVAVVAVSSWLVLSNDSYVYGPDLSPLYISSKEQTPAQNNSGLINNFIEPVSCSERLAGRSGDAQDPNQGYTVDKLPKKYVNETDPKFWISLHKEYFDQLRWVHIYKNGNYYETGITDQFKEILHSRDKKGLVIDVGMNIGWFTVYSRAMGHDVVGFDPYPIMHTRVCESLDLNGWLNDNSVKTFIQGLGEKTETLNITTGKNPGGTSFDEDRLAKRFRKKLEVSVVRLDDVAEQQGWITNEEPIYILKMDVEGYEYYVLGGASKLLQSRKIENLILENSNKDLRQVIDMYAAIYDAGYEVHMLSDVQGNPYHEEMIPGMNKELQGLSPGAELSQAGENIKFLAEVSCNLWWKRRNESQNFQRNIDEGSK